VMARRLAVISMLAVGRGIRAECDLDSSGQCELDSAAMIQLKADAPPPEPWPGHDNVASLPIRGLSGDRPPLPAEYTCNLWGATGEPLTTDMAELCNGTTREQLPTFDENDDEIWMVSMILGPLNIIERYYKKNFYTRALASGIHALVPGAMHSELLFETKGGKKFTIGYFGIGDGGLFALIYGGPGIISWSPAPCRKALNYYQAYTKVHVASASTKSLNKWLDWLPGWGAEHPHYNMYSLSNQGALGPGFSKFKRSSECGDFFEDGLKKLAEVGGVMEESWLVCRPYFGLLTEESPIRNPEGDLSADPKYRKLITTREALVTYAPTIAKAFFNFDYEGFIKAYRLAFSMPLNFTFVDGVGRGWLYHPKFPFIFPDGPLDNYQRCDLDWQPAAQAVLGECQPFVNRVWNNMIKTINGTRKLDQVCV